MKITEDKCRIQAVMLGEATINFIRPDQVPVRAKFALLAGDDGSPCGFVEKANGWSEKTLTKMRELAESMEEDVLPHIFQVSGKTPEPSNPGEPPQF